MGDDECIAVAEKHTTLTFTIIGGKFDVFHYDGVFFDAEALSGVSTTECTFVARTPDGDL